MVPPQWLIRHILLAFLLASCASGKVVDSFYLDQAKGFKVPFLQEPWRRIAVPDVELAFRDEETEAVIALFSSCGSEGRAPLNVLAKRLFFGIKERKLLERRPLSLNGAEAIHTILQGKLKEEEVKVSSYVVKRDECVYDLVYMAPPDRFEAKLLDFESFVKGWELSRRER